MTGDRSNGGDKVPRKGITIGSPGNRVDAYKGRKPTLSCKSACRRMVKNKLTGSRLSGQGRLAVGWGSGSSLPSSIPQGERHEAVGIL